MKKIMLVALVLCFAAGIAGTAFARTSVLDSANGPQISQSVDSVIPIPPPPPPKSGVNSVIPIPPPPPPKSGIASVIPIPPPPPPKS